MKTFRYLIVAVLFLLVAGTSGAQTREEKKEALKTYVGEQVTVAHSSWRQAWHIP